PKSSIHPNTVSMSEEEVEVGDSILQASETVLKQKKMSNTASRKLTNGKLEPNLVNGEYIETSLAFLLGEEEDEKFVLNVNNQPVTITYDTVLKFSKDPEGLNSQKPKFTLDSDPKSYITPIYTGKYDAGNKKLNAEILNVAFKLNTENPNLKTHPYNKLKCKIWKMVSEDDDVYFIFAFHSEENRSEGEDFIHKLSVELEGLFG
ncbi:MAG: hypothetical protein MHPSP_001123, partial [Paramarteilia canceri]